MIPFQPVFVNSFSRCKTHRGCIFLLYIRPKRWYTEARNKIVTGFQGEVPPCDTERRNALIEAVIFNLDGVLVCSDECHYRAWRQLAYEQGIQLQPELYLRMVGLKRMDSIKILLAGRDRTYTTQEMWALSVRKNDLFNEQIDRLDQESILPGALETVIALKNKGVKTAVASSSENATGILRQLRIDHWFDVVVDGTQIEKGKPDPEVYLTAARKLSMPTGNCLVIENTPAGEEGAQQAGMRCMMLANPYESNELQLPTTLAELNLPLFVDHEKS